VWGWMWALGCQFAQSSFFWLGFKCFSTMLCIRLGLSYPLVLGVSHDICSQPLDLMGIHFLCHTHGEEKMTSHDVVQNIFITIAKDAGFQVLWKQTHVLLPPTLQSLCCQVDIVLLIDGVHTLIDIVIVEPFKLIWPCELFFLVGLLQ